MQLLCNGVVLDLKKDATLSFKKSNILFAFDDVECERSVSFDLPDTPNNEQVFGLAKNPAFGGQGMRQRFAAELHDGIVSKQGYLHVEQYAGGSYKAVFVCGELTGLQALRDAGSIKDIYESVADYVIYAENTVSPTMSNPPRYANVNHMSFDYKVRPSIWVRKMITDTLDALGAQYNLPLDYNRLIIAKPVGFQQRSCTMRRYKDSNHVQGAQWASVSFGSSALDGQALALFNFVDKSITWNEYDGSGAIISTTTGTVRCLSAKQDIKMSFPSNLPSDIYMSYSTDTPNNVSLAGREIDIEKNRPFFFYKASEWIGYPNYGYSFTQDFNISANVWSGKSEPEEGDVIMLADNTPDIDVVTLLKALAALEGQVLFYENGVIKLDSLGLTDYVDYTNSLVGIKRITRSFADYAQRNVLTFASGDGSLPSEIEPISYAVPNANIEAEKQLLEIPYSQGGISAANNSLVFLRNDSQNVIASSVDNSVNYMQRAALRKCSGLQNLCSKSTTVEAVLQMTLQDWENLAPKKMVQIYGTRYIWVSGNWSNGFATLELAKAK